MKKLTTGLICIVSALFLTGCTVATNTTPIPTPSPSSSTPPSSSTSVASSTKVDIRNYAFSPAKLEVKKGTTVTFTNSDSIGHSVTADDGSFNTPIFSNGQSQQLSFDTVGTFSYHCTPHPYMKGTIVVTQ